MKFDSANDHVLYALAYIHLDTHICVSWNFRLCEMFVLGHGEGVSRPGGGPTKHQTNRES
jgi:hypothetical protein